MIFALLARLGPYVLKFLPYILAASFILGVVLWVRHMEHKVAAQAKTIAELQQNLASEQAARKNDVTGLTVLSKGLVAASSAKSKDQEALSHAIDTAHPQPASPGLAAFLACLRAADQNRQCATAAGTGPASAPAAAGSH